MHKMRLRLGVASVAAGLILATASPVAAGPITPAGRADYGDDGLLGDLVEVLLGDDDHHHHHHHHHPHHHHFGD